MIKDVKNEKIMCKFCESLNYEKQYARESNRNRDKEDKLKHSYNVALIRHTWTKRKGKRKACRTVDYRNQGIGYQLNYCPECGRMLKRKMKSKEQTMQDHDGAGYQDKPEPKSHDTVDSCKPLSVSKELVSKIEVIE